MSGSLLLASTSRPTFETEEENRNKRSSSSSSPPQRRITTDKPGRARFSIENSIELERELGMMESPPPSARTFPHHLGDDSQRHHQEEPAIQPDPEILAHLITQLRDSLASITHERDSLLKIVDEGSAREEGVKDALDAMTAKAIQAEDELGEVKKKVKEDEEQIGLLRGKVEESRRGLMRLQSESRRQSMTPIDVNRASSSAAFVSHHAPSSAKRASFAPLTGSRHAWMSSVSDGALDSTHPATIEGGTGLSPNPPSSAGSSRRLSGLFARSHSPNSQLDGAGEGGTEASTTTTTTTTTNDSTDNKFEIDSLKSEIKSLKTELENVKHELAEAKEAKEASEMCVRALRAFIAENNFGQDSVGRGRVTESTGAVKLPPPPMMMMDGDEHGSEENGYVKKMSGTGSMSGWGFRLWGGSGAGAGAGGSSSSGPGTSPGSGSENPDMLRSPSLSFSGLATPTTSNTSVSPATSPSPQAQQPLSRKLTGFFSSRSRGPSSQSSNSKRGQVPAPAPAPAPAGDSAAPIESRTNSAGSYSTSAGADAVVDVTSSSYGSGVGLGGSLRTSFGEDVTNLRLEGGGGDVDKSGDQSGGLVLHEVDLHGELR